MKTYEIKKLMVVTAIACLPVACGTQSPTGPDATAVEGDFTASAFRYQPGDGPWAPEGGGSETAPLPVPPTNEVPAPTVPDDASTEVPDGAVPQPNRGRRPVPQPSPSDETDPGSVPTPPTVPVPPPAPAPPAGPSTETPNVGCLAVSIEIVSVSTFAGTGGLALEAILLGKDGVAITDDSCEKVLWDVDSSALGDRVTIAYGANSRHVSVSGPAGTFRIAAVTPNGLRATLDIILQ